MSLQYLTRTSWVAATAMGLSSLVGCKGHVTDFGADRTGEDGGVAPWVGASGETGSAGGNGTSEPGTSGGEEQVFPGTGERQDGGGTLPVVVDGAVGLPVDPGPQVFEPPECTNAESALPSGAPSLQVGSWTNISPSNVTFGDPFNLTQGMAIDPCNPATLYLTICTTTASGAPNTGVYRTTDAGASWVRILASDSPNHVRVNPENPLELYVTDGVVGSTMGLWRTHDGGQTWEHVTNMCEAAGVGQGCGMNDLYDVAVDPTDFDHILISFHAPWDWNYYDQGAGILESFDGGDNWIPHKPSNDWHIGHSVAFLFNPLLGIGTPQTWLVGTQSTGYYRTADGGETWTQVFDVPIAHGGSSVTYDQEGMLLATVSNGVLRSADNGLTWQRIPAGFAPIGALSDGENIYSGGTTIQVTSIDDPSAWSVMPGAPESNCCGGPFELVLDDANGIVYAASNQAGLYALKIR